MKYILGVSAWAICIFAGVKFSAKLKKRESALELVSLFLKSVRIEIEYSSAPLYELIEKLASGREFSSLGFVEECRNLLESGTDFPTAWTSSLESFKGVFKEEEIERLCGLGNCLGTTDVEGQTKILSVYSEYLEEQEKKAKKKREQYGSILVYSGAFAGFALFILIV